jgi:hypothetical protein
LAVYGAHIVERCVVLRYFRHERFPMYGAETSPATTTHSVPPELFMMLTPEDQALIIRHKKTASTTVDTVVAGMPTFAKVALGALAAYGGYVLVTRAMAGGSTTGGRTDSENRLGYMTRINDSDK